MLSMKYAVPTENKWEKFLETLLKKNKLFSSVFCCIDMIVKQLFLIFSLDSLSWNSNKEGSFPRQC
ncbi:hypothetical protein BpHYR1_041373 [Brachionus plicatilis]|uniref:Uncharacterized protein n=1 Tax=Brachionus plicatilis TaxID=10195 RepID=A0A3M7SLD6_BRAPC|nr:hypothetical protein BpHYR1_041373 [Brachionus plicatilis]